MDTGGVHRAQKLTFREKNSQLNYTEGASLRWLVEIPLMTVVLQCTGER